MSVLVILIVCLLAVVAAGALAAPRLKTRRLRERFGPEYSRTVLGHGGDVHAAERELADRLKLLRGLELKPLDAAERERTERELARIQELFVDDPGTAAADADRLLTAVLDKVGYPEKGRLGAVSVHHGELLPEYRAARSTLERAQAAQVGTEELRTALIALRDLTLDVLRAEHPVGRSRPVRAGRITAAPAGPTPSAG
ncbi:hypothetical protein GCM10010495_66630 [Kitasatospora herbaricolor]|uniref:hypothetical protein n=1 Tax=Kitasatospora herbaricolor TaxID=68217 RepID=UPI00174932D4|nr:hypothetical protein [Kitasatospora herbaricolor]MDQ0313102.1 hypothetical protein [Kitasatospora herbaricolor]GGV39934.1 hypothetical protein GCM10010495_66630 [Kitasatospora herbaricolor]